MSVAVSATGTNIDSTASPINYTGITVASGDTSLLAWVVNAGGNVAPGTVQWSGTSMTQLGSVAVPTQNSTCWFYGLVNPASGNNTLAVQNPNLQNFSICAQSYTGSSGFGSVVTNTGSSAGPATVTISTAGIDLIAGCLMAQGQGLTVNGTQVFNDASNPMNIAGNRIAGGSGVAVSATFASSTTWAAIAVDIVGALIRQLEWPLSLAHDLKRQPDRSFVSFYNPTQMNTGKKPGGASGTQSYELPPALSLEPRDQLRGQRDRNWSYNYNPTQMNTGAKPGGAAGEQSFDSGQWYEWVSKEPRDHMRPQQDRTWTWNYNPAQMNTGAKPGGATGTQSYELPSSLSREPRDQLRGQRDRNWLYNYNPAQMNTGAKPAGFQYYDLTGRPVRPDANWFQNPLTFTTTVTFPPGQQVYDLTGRPYRLDETWVFNYNPTQMQAGTEPFFQTDWPLPTPRVRPDATWSFNYNSSQMNTGQLPVGFQSWDLSPRQIPFRPDVTWVYSFNPAQLNTGQFPAGFQYYDLTGRPPRPDANWLQTPLTFTTTVVFPVGQQIYDLTGRPYRLDETWVSFFNPTQMNTGVAPIGAQRLELWTPPFRPLFNWEAQAATFTAVVTNPFSQTDWPLPAQPVRLSVTWDFPTPTSYYQTIILMGQIWM